MSKILTPASSVPAELEQQAALFVQLEQDLATINKEIREFKKRSGYAERSAQLKAVKTVLFEYMVANHVKTVGSIKYAKCEPATVKKEKRQAKLLAEVETVCEDVLPDDERATAITEGIASIIIK